MIRFFRWLFGFKAEVPAPGKEVTWIESTHHIKNNRVRARIEGNWLFIEVWSRKNAHRRERLSGLKLSRKTALAMAQLIARLLREEEK